MWHPPINPSRPRDGSRSRSILRPMPNASRPPLPTRSTKPTSAPTRELEADLVTYRELLQEALSVAHDLTVERDRLKDHYVRALDELRTLRPRRTA